MDKAQLEIIANDTALPMDVRARAQRMLAGDPAEAAPAAPAGSPQARVQEWLSRGNTAPEAPAPAEPGTHPTAPGMGPVADPNAAFHNTIKADPHARSPEMAQFYRTPEPEPARPAAPSAGSVPQMRPSPRPAPRRGGGGYARAALFKDMPGHLRPGKGYFPPGYGENLKNAFANGEITKKQYDSASGVFQKWYDSSKGSFAEAGRLKTQAKVGEQAADLLYHDKMAEAQTRAAIAEIEGITQLQQSREYWEASRQDMNQRFDSLMSEMENERDRLRETSGGNAFAGIMTGIADSIAMAFGTYSASINGGPNHVANQIQQRVDNEMRQAQMEMQRGDRIRSSIGKEYAMLSKKFDNDKVAEMMLRSSIMQETASKVSAQMRMGTSQATKARGMEMIGALEASIAANEADIKFQLTRQAEKEAQAAAAARANALKMRMINAMNIRDAGGRPLSDDAPKGTRVKGTDVNGQPFVTWVDPGHAKAYGDAMQGFDQIKLALDGMAKLSREGQAIGWAGPDVDLNQFSPTAMRAMDNYNGILTAGYKKAFTLGAYDDGVAQLMEDYFTMPDRYGFSIGSRFFTTDKLDNQLQAMESLRQTVTNNFKSQGIQADMVPQLQYDEKTGQTKQIMRWHYPSPTGELKNIQTQASQNAADAGFPGMVQ